MATFEDVFVKAKKTIEKAGEKAGQALDIQKLKISAAELRYKINKDYARLGKAVYLSSQDGKNREGEREPIIAEIKRKSEALAELAQQICEAEGKTRCSACGYVNHPPAVFCSICGKKLNNTGMDE